LYKIVFGFSVKIFVISFITGFPPLLEEVVLPEASPPVDQAATSKRMLMTIFIVKWKTQMAQSAHKGCN